MPPLSATYKNHQRNRFILTTSFALLFVMAPSRRSEGKYVLTMLRYSFLAAGIFIDEKYREYEKLYAASYTVFVLAGGSAIFVIYNRVTAVSEKAEVIYALLGASCVQMVFTTYQLNKSGLRGIYTRLEKMYDIEKFGELSNRLCVKIISEYKRYVICMVVITFLVPVVIAAATDIPLGDLRTLIIPSWYPWSATSKTKYALTLIAQMFTMLVAYSLLASTVGFFSAAVMAIYSDFQILLQRLPGSKVYGKENDSWDREMKELVDHYRKLMHNDVIGLAAQFISVLLYTVIVEVVALISVFMKVEQEYLYKVKLLSACSIMMWAFFSYCVAGEVLKDLKDDLNHALYKTSWYGEDTKKRRMLLIFMILNRNPLTLKAFNMYPINLYFSLFFVKICYTVVQFMKTVL